MLSTLVTLSLAIQTQAADAASFFPPIQQSISPVLNDSEIFTYLKTGSEASIIAPYSTGPDWSKVTIPALKADAQKLKVLLFVADRDFSDPAISNILEMRDKQRLIAAMSRIQAMMQVVSDGELSLEIIPKFVPEPFFEEGEIKRFILNEYNSYKFDTDDSEERGPFSAIVALSSSNSRSLTVGGVPFDVHSFHALGGTKPQLTLEENLLKEILTQVFAQSPVSDDLGAVEPLRSGTIISPLHLFKGKFKSLLGVNQYTNLPLTLEWLKENVQQKGLKYKLRSKQDIVLKAKSEPGQVDAPAEITKSGNELNYMEKSITRDGGFAVYMPTGNDKKSFQFEVKSQSSNPVAVQFWKGGAIQREVLIGDIPDGSYALQPATAIPVTMDGSWQTVKVSLPKDFALSGVTIGAPKALKFSTRRRDETVAYTFRGFKFADEAGSSESPFQNNPTWNEAGLRDALVSGSTIAKRTALQQLLKEKPMPELKATYMALGRDIDGFTSRHAILNLMRLPLETTDVEVTAYIKGLVTTSPTEVAREAALLGLAEKPEFGTFESIVSNTVRKSWRTRLAGVKALAAIEKTTLQAKPAARVMLLNCAGQDLGVIRLAALTALNKNNEPERKKLEFALINDPSEWNRQQINHMLQNSPIAGASQTEKSLLEGSFADDSPAVRKIAKVGFLREDVRKDLQKKIVDVDPTVRGFALMQLLAIYSDAKPEEYENLLQDDHIFVIREMFQSHKMTDKKLPQTYLDRLKNHPSAFVRSLVENYSK